MKKQMSMIVIVVALLFSGGLALAEVDLYEVAEILKYEINSLNFYFNEEGPDRTHYSFRLDVVDGQVHGRFTGIKEGTYSVSTYANTPICTAFESQSTVDVVVGQTSTLEVILELSRMYRFEFAITGMPGEYEVGQQVVVSYNGNAYYGWVQSNEDGRLVVSVYLPMGFEAGVLTVQDTSGNYESAEIEVSILDVFEGDVELPYQAPSDTGEVEVNVTFAHEAGRYVRVGDPGTGAEYASIQEAIDETPEGPIDIFIGTGDYAGFTLPYQKTVSVIGQGADQTRIVDTDTARPHVIYASPWSYPETDGHALDNFEAATGPKGGGWALQLYSLEVHNGAGKRAEYYSDAAIMGEASIQLVLNNVVVTSESNTPVSVNYAHSVLVDHCDLVGPSYFDQDFAGETNGISVYNGNFDGNDVRDSIIVGCYIAFYGSVSTQYCCVYDYDILGTSETTGFVFADPLLGPGWHLYIDSPCIGAASDGLDIGLVYGE